MNNSKSNIYIGLLLVVLGAMFFGVRKLHMYVTTFSDRVIEINKEVQNLEDKKLKIGLYKKILLKGSEEQQKLDAYILSGDGVFKAITDIEKDGTRASLFGTGGISSVTKRESSSLTELQAGEVVVVIDVEGPLASIQTYIQALTHLPYVSYVEKIQVSMSENTTKTKATITLVIIEQL